MVLPSGDQRGDWMFGAMSSTRSSPPSLGIVINRVFGGAPGSVGSDVTNAIHRPSSEMPIPPAGEMLTRCGALTGFPVIVSRSTDHTCAGSFCSPDATNASRRPDAEIESEPNIPDHTTGAVV